MKNNTEFITQKPIAHRGLWNEEVAENSLIAFSRAIDAEYPIELDVQITADGKLVIFHDWSLDRVTSGNGKISEQKYDDIKDFTLGKSNQKILLFEDILNLVNGEVALIIEIKSKSHFDYKICEKVYDLLKKYNGNYAISSFNPFVIRWFAKNAPEIVRGQNFTDFSYKNFVMAFCKRLFFYFSWIMSNNKPDFFACGASMLPKSFLVQIARNKKIPVLAYAITDSHEYDRIKSVIDNNFFDNKPFT